MFESLGSGEASVTEMFEDSVEALLLIYTEGCGRCMKEEVARLREIGLQERRLRYP